MTMPDTADSTELSWTSTESKRRGIFGFDSLDPRSRSFNLIRAKLLEFQTERGWRLIGVVSATPNVGKSFIAANLAAALDPGLFVVGGGVSAAGELLLGPARETFRRTLTGRGYRTEAAVVTAAMGNEAGLVGAADLSRRGPRERVATRG